MFDRAAQHSSDNEVPWMILGHKLTSPHLLLMSDIRHVNSFSFSRYASQAVLV